MYFSFFQILTTVNKMEVGMFLEPNPDALKLITNCLICEAINRQQTAQDDQILASKVSQFFDVSEKGCTDLLEVVVKGMRNKFRLAEGIDLYTMLMMHPNTTVCKICDHLAVHAMAV